jgi:hypothetical protein
VELSAHVVPLTQDVPVSFEGLEPVADVSVADWIAPRLRGFGGRVHYVVPDGFAAYARVLHPAGDGGGEPVPWAEVCRATGRTAHALMQWNSIAGVVRHTEKRGRWPRRYEFGWETSEWTGTPPEQGNVRPDLLVELLDVLAVSTPDDGDCFHALWEGWGWLHEGAWSLLTLGTDSLPPRSTAAEPGLPADVLAGPRLLLPNRDYLVFRGPLDAARRMGHQITDDWFSPQSPSLLWPADRSWCLATEIDFDSTLIGGPQELIDALLHRPGLEAWPVSPADDLSFDGDLLNR